MNIGDRVKFKTMGGWYNRGTVEEIDKESCLVKVDRIGYDKGYIALPYYARVLLCEIDEQEVEE